MNKRKRMVSILAGVMAAVMALTLIMSLVPMQGSALSSSEIRSQINQLKKEKAEIQEKIKEVEGQYEENENEIADIIAKKNVIDQQVQLLFEQVENINEQLSTYNVLIADKQDELDSAMTRYRSMNEENRVRVRAMEEEGELSYWEVLFNSNSFTDLLDRLSMVEEIAAADNKHLQEMSDAAQAVEDAQNELEAEKEEVEAARAELDATQAELDQKKQEAVDLLQELLSKADDLEALKAEFEEMDNQFLEQIAAKEVEFSAAKQAEWAAYMATYVPPTAGFGGTTGGGSGGSSGGGGWLIPTTYSSITSPFGNRTSPTAGASSNHLGIDLDSTTGTPVVASRAGIVSFSGYGSAAGNYIIINHQDGFSSTYMHLNSRSVSTGQIVSAGQTIGTVGATGVVTGDHLHFAIQQNGVYVNPANYVNLH